MHGFDSTIQVLSASIPGERYWNAINDLLLGVARGGSQGGRVKGKTAKKPWTSKINSQVFQLYAISFNYWIQVSSRFSAE
jgi:hypothetical protein